jgi:DNA-binding SARP family transcriptional activator
LAHIVRGSYRPLYSGPCPEGTEWSTATWLPTVASVRMQYLTLRLMLFDCWRLVADQQMIYAPARTKRLAALLALRGRQPRAQLAGALWPDVDEERAHTSLRAALSAFHRQLPGLVEKDHGEVQLADLVKVDVDEFRTNAKAVLSDCASELPVAIDHPTVIGGELLPGWYDDWVLVERERIRLLRLHVLEALASRLLARGACAQAIQAALTAVEIDPLRESAHRLVIRAHLAEGNTAEAVRAYQQFRSALRKELDVEPTHQMTDLVQHLIETDHSRG